MSDLEVMYSAEGACEISYSPKTFLNFEFDPKQWVVVKNRLGYLELVSNVEAIRTAQPAKIVFDVERERPLIAISIPVPIITFTWYPGREAVIDALVDIKTGMGLL